MELCNHDLCSALRSIEECENKNKLKFCEENLEECEKEQDKCWCCNNVLDQDMCKFKLIKSESLEVFIICCYHLKDKQVYINNFDI